jgi:uncharacterized DUF497 family protein
MRFEWDIRKDRSNRAKHGVSLELAQLAFADPLKKDIEVQFHGDEERWLTVARLPMGRLLTVVWTQRNESGEDVIRLIPVRKASNHERRRYEEDS